VLIQQSPISVHKTADPFAVNDCYIEYADVKTPVLQICMLRYPPVGFSTRLI